LPPAVGTMTKFFSLPPASSMNFSSIPDPFRLPPPTITSVPVADPYSGASAVCATGQAAVSARTAMTSDGRVRMRLYLDGRRNEALEAEVGDEVAVVLVVVADLANERAQARDLVLAAERGVHRVGHVRVGQLRERGVAVLDRVVCRPEDRFLRPRGFLE